MSRLLGTDFFPEWLQARAQCHEGSDWIGTLYQDLQLIDVNHLSNGERQLFNDFSTFMNDWRSHLNNELTFVASLIRQSRKLRDKWLPMKKDESVLSPDGGYYKKIKGHYLNINCLAVLPDGRLASGSMDETLRVWDTSSGQSKTLEGHKGAVTCLAVLPDGRLASGSWDETVRVWDTSTGQSKTLEGHKGTVKCLAVLPDGRLASGSWDETVRVWDTSTGQSKTLEGHKGTVKCLAVLPDGRLASGSWDETVRVWRQSCIGDNKLQQIGFFESIVTCLAWCTRKQILAVGLVTGPEFLRL